MLGMTALFIYQTDLKSYYLLLEKCNFILTIDKNKVIELFSFNFVLLNISIFSICFCYIVEYECSTTVRYKRHTTSYENYINGNKERSGINSSIKYWIISAKFVLRNYFDVTVSPPECRRFAAFSTTFISS